MDRLTATLLCLAAFSLAPVAHAQQHDMSQHDMSQHAMHAPAAAQPMPMKGMMAMMDPDGDGKITAAEHAAAAQAMFEKADANHDGNLTHEEMMAAHAGMGMGMHMQACPMGEKTDQVGEAVTDK